MHANDLKPEDSFSEIIEGERLAVVSTGHISHQVKNVCESLNSEGHSIGFFDIFRIKPFSNDTFNKKIKKYHKVAIVEEQTPFGGIYEQVQSSLMEYRNFKEIKQFSLPDKPIYDYGSREWIRGKYKLGADYLYGEFKEFFDPRFVKIHYNILPISKIGISTMGMVVKMNLFISMTIN